NRNLHASRADDLAQLHGRRRGIAERTEVLEEFERTLEGIGTGVKQVLARAGVRGQGTGNRGQGMASGGRQPSETRESTAAYPWSLVCGVVADFVQVGVEHAAAIDVALGEAAQAVVIDGGTPEIQEVIAAASDLTGRVVAIHVPVVGQVPVEAPQGI